MAEGPMRGPLDAVPLLEAFSVLARYRRTGSLTLRTRQDEVIIHFERGAVRSVSTNDESIRIGQVLIQQGHVTEEQIEQALALQSVAEDPERIGEVLVDIGYISKTAISQAISQQIQSALVTLLREKTGTFEFVPTEPEDERSAFSSRISFEPLVLNATYLADRWLAEQEPEHIDLLPDTLIDPAILERVNPQERELLNQLIATYNQLHALAWRYGQAAQQVKRSVERLLEHVVMQITEDPVGAHDSEPQVDYELEFIDVETDLWSLTDLTRNARHLLLFLLNGETRLSALTRELAASGSNPDRAVQELVSAGLIRVELVVGNGNDTPGNAGRAGSFRDMPENDGVTFNPWLLQ